LVFAGVFHAEHPAAPAVQVAHDVAHEFIRRNHGHLHDRLEQNGIRLFGGLRKARDPAILKAISDESTA